MVQGSRDPQSNIGAPRPNGMHEIEGMFWDTYISLSAYGIGIKLDGLVHWRPLTGNMSL